MQKKRDYIWYTLGFLAFSAVYPILSVITTRICEPEEAGKFAIAFATAQTFMFIGKFGVRNFQISDIHGEYNFKEYLGNRIITCALMMISGVVFCIIKAYDGKYALLVLTIFAYKMMDALADVFEGRLQQEKLLHVAGKSLFAKSVIPVVVFSALLMCGCDILCASLAMLAFSVVILIFTAVGPTYRKTNPIGTANLGKIKRLLMVCFPLFFSQFLFSFINNSPKYAVEERMSYEYVTYFNVLYFPAQVIYMIADFVFKPMLVELTEQWEKRNCRWIEKFVTKIIGIICGITMLLILGYYFCGISLLEMVFGMNLAEYKSIGMLMLINGLFVATISFFYSVYSVFREQKFLARVLTVGGIVSTILPTIMTRELELLGATMGYMLTLGFVLIIELVYFKLIMLKSKK